MQMRKNVNNDVSKDSPIESHQLNDSTIQSRCKSYQESVVVNCIREFK